MEEKIGMIHGGHLFSTRGVERLGIPPLVMSDGPMGVRREFEPDHWKAIDYSDDYVTYLPCNSALASTWNRDLAFAMGSVLGAEARGRGKDIILAPGVNIKRSPLCGRNFEYFSEDPYLTGELAVPFIQGVQQWDVAACVKHFAANNQETQRLFVDVEIDEKVLREIYLPAFYDCLVRGKSLSVMGAYNRIYGEHCCQSEYLLNDILRKEWGYEGVAVSDWGGVHDTQLSAMSGLDIEMSVTDNFDEYFMADPLKKAVEQGMIPEVKVNEKVIRILMLMIKLHMIKEEDAPERKSGKYNSPGHRKTALEIARESLILLKNKRKILPLNPRKVKRILVVGENAERIHSNGGGQGLREKKENQILKEKRELLRKEAVEAAKDYDTVIFVGGLNHDYDSEGIDRSDMKLPYGQDALIRELFDVNRDMILVLVGGSAVEMGEWADRADTVLWSYYAGMEGGTALAEALFGRVNPSGKLPETFYKKHTDCSAHALGEFAGEKSVAYKEGIFVGYRYNETFGVKPEFCFGHGLSYTDFVYEDAVYETADGCGYVICRVTNTGKYPGGETVQVYRMSGQGEPLPERLEKETDLAGLCPVKELAGFGKIYLEPGETGQVKISVKGNPEECSLGVGASVEDIRIMIRG